MVLFYVKMVLGIIAFCLVIVMLVVGYLVNKDSK